MTCIDNTTLPTERSNLDDADLLALVQQFTTSWNEWGRLDEGAPRISRLSDRCEELSYQIVITPAHTPRGLAGKRRVMRLAELEDNQDFFRWVLARDAERVGVKRPGRPRKADAVEAVAAI